jgi:hypothetical protein
VIKLWEHIMPKIKIDDLEYNSEDLSEAGKGQFRSLQFLEKQTVQLRNEIAAYQTAHGAYVAALKKEIEENGIKPEKA